MELYFYYDKPKYKKPKTPYKKIRDEVGIIEDEVFQSITYNKNDGKFTIDKNIYKRWKP